MKREDFFRQVMVGLQDSRDIFKMRILLGVLGEILRDAEPYVSRGEKIPTAGAKAALAATNDFLAHIHMLQADPSLDLKAKETLSAMESIVGSLDVIFEGVLIEAGIDPDE